VAKVRSTPDDPAEAVHRGIVAAVGDEAVLLHYGSTVATNALLERRGARILLVTTMGFEDVIEIGRQTRAELYDLEPRRPAPVVPRTRRIGVRERVLHDGTVLVRLARRDVRAVVAAAKRLRVDAVAVALLHSYANPDHELTIGEALAPLGLHVTLSHALLREYREYERTSTAAVNAYVGPLMADHLGRLGRRTRGGIRVMQSSGGLVGGATATAEPVRTVLSGPAGGVVGAARVAARAGLGPIITLDMGGTSTDVSVVDGPLAFRTEASIDGLPIRVPILDIHTVGAGGGSLARLDAGGALRVGPESAGAVPGPACYGTGRSPTVTDAHLVMGRLVADRFLGGAMRLDGARARAALGPLARRMGRGVAAAADGVVAVATASMERAVRVITVERGLDPREFTLFAFGGAGALHASALADALGIRRVYVPRNPGLLSAWGMLAAEVVRDDTVTVRAVQATDALLEQALRPLVRRVRTALGRDGVGRPMIEPSLDVRYVGQSYEVQVPFTRGWRRDFHRRHERLYGHAAAGRPIEVVSVRVRGRGGGRLPSIPRLARRRARPVAQARVWFGRWRDTPVWDRETLGAGWRARGPAVVCELSATTVVPPGWRVRTDPLGGLMLEVADG
jgi:N-methylhydantoinase A